MSFLVPENVPAPDLEPLSSSSILLTIYPPGTPNGVINQYSITRQWGVSQQHTFTISVNDASVINYTDTSLSPFTNYSYTVMACNGIGCATGPSAAALTLEAPPTEVLPPSTSLVGDGYSISVSWIEPAQPNGVLSEYNIIRSELGFEAMAAGQSNCCNDYITNGALSNNCTLVSQVSPPLTSVTDEAELSPFSYYQYCVIAATNGGSTPSNYSSPLRTAPASQPLTGPTPTAIPLNATSIHVSWSPLSVDLLLGQLEGYSLTYYSDDGEPLTVDNIEDESYTITGLAASTLYYISVSFIILLRHFNASISLLPFRSMPVMDRELPLDLPSVCPHWMEVIRTHFLLFLFFIFIFIVHRTS